jgi:hypothetical protein
MKPASTTVAVDTAALEKLPEAADNHAPVGLRPPTCVKTCNLATCGQTFRAA